MSEGHKKPLTQADFDNLPEEMSSVSIQAYVRRDPMAIKLKEHDRAIEKLNAHFEPTGMVGEVHSDMKFVKTLFTKFFPLALPFILGALAGIWWMIQHANQPPTPEPIDYDRLGQAVAKHQAAPPPVK